MLTLDFLRIWLTGRLGIDERGANLVEYVILIAFIAVLAVVAVQAFGQSVSTQFSEIDSSIQ